MFNTIVIICAALFLILYLTVWIMAKTPKKREPSAARIRKIVVEAPGEPRLTPFQKIDLRNEENMKHRFYSHDYRR